MVQTDQIIQTDQTTQADQTTQNDQPTIRYSAQWIGDRPQDLHDYCAGYWKILRYDQDGRREDISDQIPEYNLYRHMGTFGEYTTKDIKGHETTTFHGKTFDKWSKDNDLWLRKICPTEADRRALYQEINDHDFRPVYWPAPRPESMSHLQQAAVHLGC